MSIEEYYNMGFSVLVCGAHSKHPLSKALPQACRVRCDGTSVVPRDEGGKERGTWRDYQHTRATLEQLNEWATRYPRCNWAIVTGKVSGVVVIDTDNPDAEEYASHRGLPSTLTAKTKKGYHYYYRYPTEHPIQNTTALHGVAGLDIRGEGGYVIAPPSTHPDGGAYEWVTPLDNTPIAELPAWVYEQEAAHTNGTHTNGNGNGTHTHTPTNGNGNGNRENAYLRAALEGKLRDACARIESARDGTKHDTLRDNAIILGGYIHMGLDREHIANEMMSALPVSVKDRNLARQTIYDGIDYGAARPLTIEVPAVPQPAASSPVQQPAPASDDDKHITIDGTRWKLPPGCTYSNGCIYRGEKIIYLGKLLVPETGTNVHTNEQTALIQWRGTVKGECVTLRSDIASQSGITKLLGGAGAAVHAHNARDISRYLVEFIQVNRKNIEHSRHSAYYGNVDGVVVEHELGVEQ